MKYSRAPVSTTLHMRACFAELVTSAPSIRDAWNHFHMQFYQLVLNGCNDLTLTVETGLPGQFGLIDHHAPGLTNFEGHPHPWDYIVQGFQEPSSLDEIVLMMKLFMNRSRVSWAMPDSNVGWRVVLSAADIQSFMSMKKRNWRVGASCWNPFLPVCCDMSWCKS